MKKRTKNKTIGDLPKAKESIGIGTTILSFVFPFVGVVKAYNNLGEDEGRAAQLLKVSIASTITWSLISLGMNIGRVLSENQQNQKITIDVK